MKNDEFLYNLNAVFDDNSHDKELWCTEDVYMTINKSWLQGTPTPPNVHLIGYVTAPPVQGKP